MNNIGAAINKAIACVNSSSEYSGEPLFDIERNKEYERAMPI